MGFGLPLNTSYLIAGIITAVLIGAVFAAAVKRRKLDDQEAEKRAERDMQAGRSLDDDSRVG